MCIVQNIEEGRGDYMGEHRKTNQRHTRLHIYRSGVHQKCNHVQSSKTNKRMFDMIYITVAWHIALTTMIVNDAI